ncbi:MAG: phosphoglycerate kinase [Actinomycetes bacterium]
MPIDLPLLEDLPSIKGARVLVRCELNTPIADGVVADDLRLTSAIPTIDWLRDQGAAVVIAAHLGRPKGVVDQKFSLAPVALRLSELLGAEIELSDQIFGSGADSMIASLSGGEVMMLENLRFVAGEEANNPAFVSNLVAPFDLYVNDAFGASHRSHGSIVGPPLLLPSAAGFLLRSEVETLGGLLGQPAKPFIAVLGGSKVSDKLGIIKALLSKCDRILVGGAMAFTFLAAKGYSVGDSLLEVDFISACGELLATGRVDVPVDIVIAKEISEDAEAVVVKANAIPDGWKGLDIGPETAALFADQIGEARTILWNGPMGVFEVAPFAGGTITVAEAVAECSGFTVVGGGDSAAAVRAMHLDDQIDHMSTGGGASLEFLELGDLPGLAALRKGRPSQ